MTSRTRAFSEALGRLEGFFVAPGTPTYPTVPQRLKNPGDLIFAHQKGATPHAIKGADGRVRVYAEFATIEAGWLACDRQVELYAGRGLTVEQTIRKWAPADDGNDPRSYTAAVCKLMACKP